MVSLALKIILLIAENDSKYRDVAPLNNVTTHTTRNYADVTTTSHHLLSYKPREFVYLNVVNFLFGSHPFFSKNSFLNTLRVQSETSCDTYSPMQP